MNLLVTKRKGEPAEITASETTSTKYATPAGEHAYVIKDSDTITILIHGYEDQMQALTAAWIAADLLEVLA